MKIDRIASKANSANVREFSTFNNIIMADQNANKQAPFGNSYEMFCFLWIKVK